MTFEDVVFDPFVRRDRIPRTPPAAALGATPLLKTACCGDARLPDSSQTSMFQTDQNRPRYFIKLKDSPLSQGRCSLRCPLSFNVRCGESEKNAHSSVSPNLTHVEDSIEESSVLVSFNAAEVVSSKRTTRSGRNRDEEKNFHFAPLPYTPPRPSSEKKGEISGTSGGHEQRKAHLGATLTTGAFEASCTSDFKRPGRMKRRQMSTQSPSLPVYRHDLQRTTSSLNCSAPRRRRRLQGDSENDISSPPISPITLPTNGIRGRRRSKCHELFNSPPKVESGLSFEICSRHEFQLGSGISARQKLRWLSIFGLRFILRLPFCVRCQLTETSSAILGSLGLSGCRRSQRNVARVNYAGL